MAAELLSVVCLGRQASFSVVVSIGGQTFASTCCRLRVVRGTEEAGGVCPVVLEGVVVFTEAVTKPAEDVAQDLCRKLQEVADCACESREGFVL